MKHRSPTAALWLAAVSTLSFAAHAQGAQEAHEDGALLFAQKCALCQARVAPER